MAKLTGEERKRILAKIKKLLALKEGAEKIGSEGEAYAAANGVHRLLTEYNLSTADVMGEDGERKGPKIEESDGISYASHFGLWKQKLMGIICRYNYCQSIISPQTKQVVIVGQEDNIAVCHQLYDYLVKAFVRLAKEKFLNCYAIHDMPLSVARIQIGEKEVQEFFHSYYIGVDQGLIENFESRQPTSDECALVVTHKTAIDDYLKKLNIKQRRGSVNYGRLDGNALMEGYRDGKNINLDRQIGGSENLKIGRQ